MTGICGWIGGAVGVEARASSAKRMLSGLSGLGNESVHVGEACFLGARCKNSGVGSDNAGTVFAALDGDPEWKCSRLRQVSADKSCAAALAMGYVESGKAVLQQLRGSFSLCVFDSGRNYALLAVDRMGRRPLYYSHAADGSLVFGSTASAILASGHVSNELSQQSILDYFFFHVVPSPKSIYSKIGKLEPSQYLELDEQSVQSGFYWLPEIDSSKAPDSDVLQSRMRDCLRSSIAKTQPDAGTAAFLSGGLDSSTVNGLANEIVEQELPAFSIGFDQEEYNELEFARIAARHFGLNLNEYYVTRDDVADVIDVVASLDEPFGNSSIVPAYFCALRARESGATRMLAGDGGDELFAGNERYAKQKVFDYYWRLPAYLRQKFVEPLVLRIPANWSMPTRKLRRYVEQARIPMPDRLFTYTHLQTVAAETVFDPRFLSAVDDRHPIDNAREWYRKGGDADLVDKMLFFDWKLTLADNDLPKVNMACDLAGVEVEYPMLDDDLVDFSLRVPARDKITPYNLRAFFKESFSGFLPPEIINKQKHGFGLPFGEWLLTSPRLVSRVDAAFERQKDRGIFKADFLDELRRQHRDEHAAYFGNLIWVVLILEEWLNHHDT